MFRIPQRTPFDDDVNFQAEANDLSYSLMYEYLRASGSRLLADVGDKTPLDVAESLRVVTGPPEDRHPVNVGLMFFNDHPEDFFRNARIEVVYKPNPTGRGMEKHISTGPLDRQLRNTMSYISRHIREYVTKVEDRPEAIREFNYPLLAVEEAISNAVYHKGYDTPEPITVRSSPTGWRYSASRDPIRASQTRTSEEGRSWRKPTGTVAYGSSSRTWTW